MYNVGLYNVRQFYFSEKQYLRYESNYHQCKENENYQLLQTDIAQQTLKVVSRSFESFFKLIQTAKKGLYRFEQIRIPRYLPKDGYFPLIMPRIKIKDRFFNIPMSRAFKKEYGTVKIPFPERLKDKELKEVRILPRYNARFFEVEFIIKEDGLPSQESEATPARFPRHGKVHQETDNSLAIDLGLNNLAACVSNTGSSFILDGRKLKSINQWYNKRNAKLASLKDKQGIKGITAQQVSITVNRNNRVRDDLNKAVRYIANWCRENQVTNIVVGVNPGMKKKINLGKKTNQKFVQIPHHSFRTKLSAMCERYGWTYIEQEESYSSKASFIDGDELPIFNADNPTEYKFSGKRIKRGLYKSKHGILVNADCQAAANIGRKSNLNGFTPDRVAASLAMPLRIKFDFEEHSGFYIPNASPKRIPRGVHAVKFTP